MSQFDPPAQPPQDPDQGYYDAEMAPTGPPPMSAMAIAGFVSSACSILICCPVLPPLLGLIFSIIGLINTAGGARRGRLLAIFGLIIGLLGLPVHLMGVRFVAGAAQGIASIETAHQAFATDQVDEGARRIHSAGTESFQAAVSEAALKTWIANKLEEYGGLQSAQMDPSQQATPVTGDTVRYTWIFRFPEKTVDVDVDLTFDLIGGSMAVADYRFDGQSVREALGGAPAGDTESSEEEQDADPPAGP